MPTYSSALRNSLDEYLITLTGILDECSNLRSSFEDALAQDFDYWQTYRVHSLEFFFAVNNIQKNVIRAIDALDKIRHTHEALNSGDS